MKIDLFFRLIGDGGHGIDLFGPNRHIAFSSMFFARFSRGHFLLLQFIFVRRPAERFAFVDFDDFEADRPVEQFCPGGHGLDRHAHGGQAFFDQFRL